MIIGLLAFSYTRLNAQLSPPVKISSNSGGFTGELDDADNFGTSIVYMGDVDRDGIQDLAVGAPGDDDGGQSKGAVWILFMATDGDVKSHQKLSETEGGFINPTGDFGFGRALVNPGDLDADGTDELVVADNTNIHVLFLNGDGTVIKQALPFQMSSTRTWTLSGSGDLDGNGAPELIVGGVATGTRTDNMLYTLSPDGSAIRSFASIGFDTGSSGEPAIGIGDIDNNGVVDVATGEPESGGELGAPASGAVVIHFLEWEETQVGGRRLIIARRQRIDLESGGLEVDLTVGSRFGSSLSALGDIDGDEIPDLVVGSPTTPGGGRLRGAAHVLFLNRDGTVKSDYSIEGGDASSGLVLKDGDRFGADVEVIGDFNQDGISDIAIGAPYDDDGGQDRGAVRLSFGLPEIPPRVTIGVETPMQPVVGQNVTVLSLVEAVGGISEVEIFFRRGGDASFFSSAMIADGRPNYSYAIPAFVVSERGIEYFVRAETSSGVSSRMPASGSESIVVVSPEGLIGPVPGGTSQNSYRIVSVPIDLDEKAARAVFESNFGPYDVSDWRLYTLDPGSRLTELNTSEFTLEPGKAYWMLRRETGRVFNTGRGSSISTSEPFAVPLRSDWNLVGTPFAFEIPLSNVYTAGDTQPTLWRFEGTWSVEDEAIRPFDGYAVFSERFDTLWIDPDLSPENVAANQSRQTSSSLPGSRRTIEQRMQLETIFGSADHTGPFLKARDLSLSVHPNPSGGSTILTYELSEESWVDIRIFDMLGREVATLLSARQSPGRHKLSWNGRDASGQLVGQGLYFFRMRDGEALRSSTVSIVR